ncbi:hypothetical protein [Arthrobacter sp. ISL-72]|uniref:hypothetical protein n=1 Tax=Arthrobacter sp. ISL-72 TaxID=2819114 RepID=UPI001BE6CFE6|nr:hypothetical protein [Arthrobacter sp. ISL-72]MBT2596243.1 hypothetical protein [Arthrobacter sp. ISL-72]
MLATIGGSGRVLEIRRNPHRGDCRRRTSRGIKRQQHLHQVRREVAVERQHHPAGGAGLFG